MPDGNRALTPFFDKVKQLEAKRGKKEVFLADYGGMTVEEIRDELLAIEEDVWPPLQAALKYAHSSITALAFEIYMTRQRAPVTAIRSHGSAMIGEVIKFLSAGIAPPEQFAFTSLGSDGNYDRMDAAAQFVSCLLQEKVEPFCSWLSEAAEEYLAELAYRAEADIGLRFNAEDEISAVRDFRLERQRMRTTH